MADQDRLRSCDSKPRVFVTTDMRNEPDDAESLVRYMLYSNEFDTRGIVACTSVHMRYTVHPEDIETIIKAYGLVRDNLNAHAHPNNQYSAPEDFLSLVSTGPASYGLEALGSEISDGSALLIQRVDEADDPLWVLCWGGANVIAQSLHHVQQSRDAAEFASFRSKLRVYTISDQDDSGAWIRQNFPDIFYICSIHGWKEYGNATWFGIAGDVLYEFDAGGPDVTKVTREWLKEHIQIGPLGAKYPTHAFLMEGDSPTFMYLIQNGLGSPEHPEWGSWGGRYTLADVSSTRSRHYADASDWVFGANGKLFISNHATIWRWRDHYQNDFAARMQWTLTNDRKKANHAPVVTVNGSSGPQPLLLNAEPGAELVLDASESYDPDGDQLAFEWIHYKEVTKAQELLHWHASDIEIQPLHHDKSQVKVQLPPAAVSAANGVTGEALKLGMVHHFVLQVTDNGSPPLTTYKRVVVQTTNDAMVGGTGIKHESTTASLGIPEGQYWQNWT